MRKTLTILLVLFTLTVRAQSDTTHLNLVYVEWEYIVNTDSGWHNYDTVKEWVDNQDSIVSQIGFLLREDSNYIVLMDSYFKDGTIGVVTRIPRGVIKKLVPIKITLQDK